MSERSFTREALDFLHDYMDRHRQIVTDMSLELAEEKEGEIIVTKDVMIEAIKKYFKGRLV